MGEGVRPGRTTKRERRFLLLGAGVSAVVAMVVGLTTSALGNHFGFTDVTHSNPFGREIASVYEAGIVTGFPGNQFKPRDAVNRQQFAGWTVRSGGRIEQFSASSVSLPLAQDDVTQIAGQAEITPGAVNESGNLGGVITASFRTTQPFFCPCRVSLYVFIETSTDDWFERVDATIPNDDNGYVDDHGSVVQSVTLPFVVALGSEVGNGEPGQPITVAAGVSRSDDTVPNINVDVTGWVQYVPFDGDAFAPGGGGSSGTSSGGSSGTSSGGSSGTSSGGSSGTSSGGSSGTSSG